MKTEGTKVCDGKKIINGKSYNIGYDSEKITEYVEIIDYWARTRYHVYQKKSTGEYFQYSRWSGWNDDWDIELMDEKDVLVIKDNVSKGNCYKFVAFMADFPGEKGTKGGSCFWGKKE